jgi:hypothetical protein
LSMCCETQGGIDCETLWQTTVSAEMMSFDHGSENGVGYACIVSRTWRANLCLSSL